MEFYVKIFKALGISQPRISQELVSGLSPCTLPTVVFVAGYVGGYSQISRIRGFVISLAFVLGLSLTFA